MHETSDPGTQRSASKVDSESKSGRSRSALSARKAISVCFKLSARCASNADLPLPGGPRRTEKLDNLSNCVERTSNSGRSIQVLPVRWGQLSSPLEALPKILSTSSSG